MEDVVGSKTSWPPKDLHKARLAGNIAGLGTTSGAIITWNVWKDFKNSYSLQEVVVQA